VTELTLKANTRDVLGKKTRFLRGQSITPAHLFGHDIESLALQCDTTELQDIISRGGTTRLIGVTIEGEGKPRSVFIREIQRNNLNGQLLHVDFYQIKMTEKMTAHVPIILTGEAPATKDKANIIEQSLTELAVECLPEKLPPQIEIDLGTLEEAGQSVHVQDLRLDPDITVTTPGDYLIVKVGHLRITEEKEEEAVAAEAEEITEAAQEGAAPGEEESKEEQPK
jgi:large subunit ribosomal protein L25